MAATDGMLALEFDFLGERQLRRRLGVMAVRVKDLRPAWDRIHRRFLSMEREQFSSSGARGPSGAWVPLSPAYAKWKQRHFPGQPILVATGRMQASLTRAGDSDHIYQALPLSMVTGTATESITGYPYPRAHQTGSKKRPGRPPRRPPIELTERDKRDVVREIQIEVHETEDVRDVRLPALR